MKAKQRIDIEELGRHLLSEKEMKDNEIILTEETAKVIVYCMNVFLKEMAMANQRKEEKEFNYLYNNFAEDLWDKTYDVSDED